MEDWVLTWVVAIGMVVGHEAAVARPQQVLVLIMEILVKMGVIIVLLALRVLQEALIQ